MASEEALARISAHLDAAEERVGPEAAGGEDPQEK